MLHVRSPRVAWATSQHGRHRIAGLRATIGRKALVWASASRHTAQGHRGKVKLPAANNMSSHAQPSHSSQGHRVRREASHCTCRGMPLPPEQATASSVAHIHSHLAQSEAPGTKQRSGGRSAHSDSWRKALMWAVRQGWASAESPAKAGPIHHTQV